MGQYYRGAVLEKSALKRNEVKVEFSLCPYQHNNGAKLMEHSYVGNYYVEAYERELSSRYYGSPFVWVGDYADNKFDKFNVYELAHNKTTEVDKKTLCSEDRSNWKYLINFDKKMFVRIPELSENWDIHPLPLLCADGNQRGGGDYYGANEELVGSWAYDRIGIDNEIPKGITTELVVSFKERYDGGKGNDYKYVEVA